MIRAVFVLLLLTSILVTAKDKITSIAEARAAVKANVSTKDGEAFDQKIGTEFGKKYAQVMPECVGRAGDDLESFEILFRLDKGGTVKEVLSDPTTKVASCISKRLARDNFSAPPRPDYWLNIDMKLTNVVVDKTVREH